MKDTLEKINNRKNQYNLTKKIAKTKYKLGQAKIKKIVIRRIAGECIISTNKSHINVETKINKDKDKDNEIIIRKILNIKGIVTTKNTIGIKNMISMTEIDKEMVKIIETETDKNIDKIKETIINIDKNLETDNVIEEDKGKDKDRDHILTNTEPKITIKPKNKNKMMKTIAKIHLPAAVDKKRNK